jgi:hypothetical protein
MKKQKLTLLALAAGLGLAGSAYGQATFVFENSGTTIGGALSGQSSGSFAVDGIEITATASIDEFNATGSGFGINQSASGDDTDGFDFTETAGLGVAEGFTLSFDQAVTLISFDVSSWNAGGDEVTLLDGATTIGTITSTGSTLLGNYALAHGSSIIVNTTAGTYGNGWSFGSITVSAVPEPGSFALIAGCLGMVSIMLKRRRT